MRNDDNLQKAFQVPVAQSQPGRFLVWRPGANPARLYRRTSAFRKIVALHEQVWTLLTSNQVTQGDVDALQQAATEIAKIDHVLAEQKFKIGYNRAGEAGTALQAPYKEAGGPFS